MFNNWLERQQSNPRQSNFDLDERLRPFGYPFFPEVVAENQIVLSTLSSSIIVFFRWVFFLGAILFAFLYSNHQYFEGLIASALFVFCAFYPSRTPETIIISPTGILLTNHLFVFKHTTLIPRQEICKLGVENKTWGIYHTAVISVARVNNRTNKIFSLTRKNHKDMVEDSQVVVSTLRKILGI